MAKIPGYLVSGGIAGTSSHTCGTLMVGRREDDVNQTEVLIKVFSGEKRTVGLHEREVLKRAAGTAVVEVWDELDCRKEVLCTVFEKWDKPLRSFISDLKSNSGAVSWLSAKWGLQRRVR